MRGISFARYCGNIVTAGAAVTYRSAAGASGALTSPLRQEDEADRPVVRNLFPCVLHAPFITSHSAWKESTHQAINTHLRQARSSQNKGLALHYVRSSLVSVQNQCDDSS